MKELATHGFTVLVESRNLEHGKTAAKRVGADTRAVQLDVTNQNSIAGRREDIVLTTKVSRPTRDERNHQGGARRWLVTELKNSQRREPPTTSTAKELEG